MDFALSVAWRYLRAKRQNSISVIGAIAIVGITLGVGALCAVLAVTSGFQAAFQEKFSASTRTSLVLKYGWDFTEYREVIARVRANPEVVGAAPFLINPMMITRGERIAGVLVKGVDPELMGTVLDLPSYLIAPERVSPRALRRPGATPPSLPGEEPSARQDRTLDDYLQRARQEVQTLRTHGESALLRPTTPTQQTAPTPALPEPPAPPMPLPGGATPTYELPPDLPVDEDPVEALARRVREEAEQQARQQAGTLPGVMIGKTLARTLNASVGDQVRIISPLTGADAALVRHGATPRARDFRVVGIFDAGFDEYDSRLVYVDLWEAQRFFEQGDAVTGVEVKVRDIDRAAAIGRRIERELGGGPYHTLDWERLNHNLFTALKLQKFALSIVITIIIIVAAFNVVASLVMVVLEKRREIAILKAMGADESAILRIFLYQGLAIGGVGTLFGLLLGGGICAALTRWHFPLDPQVYLIRFVPVNASPLEFAITGVVAMTISLLASLLPASWAASLEPVEGLRYE